MWKKVLAEKSVKQGLNQFQFVKQSHRTKASPCRGGAQSADRAEGSSELRKPFSQKSKIFASSPIRGALGAAAPVHNKRPAQVSNVIKLATMPKR